jgi:arylsulfatase A-like enzyme/Flp pilus assembly protein TadD
LGFALGIWDLGFGISRASRSEISRAQHANPSIVLVTLDTVRADRMGFLGSTRGLTPSMDRLARESIVFTRAYAQAPVTTVSHATLLSGTYPPFHGVIDFGVPLPPAVPYLPDLLKQRGYRTAAFVGSLILDPRAGTAPGFERGFETYDAGFRIRRPGEDRYQTLERRGEEVVTRAIRWLDGAKAAPFFLWVHLYDPHDPYDPPADLKAKYGAAPYDGEIAGVDRQVGRLLEVLRTRGVFANTAIVVTADHGEALGEHGEDTHGVFLYDETIRVPLLVRPPGGASTAVTVTTRVRLADVAPTILEAAALPRAEAMQGESLLPLARTPAASDRPAYAETQYPRRGFGWSPLVSWRAERFLFVRAPKRELYDQVSDPSATKNIAETRARVTTGIEAELEQFVRKTAAGSRPAESAQPDPEVAQRLASLGYVGGSGGSRPISGIDPKDRIATANALHTAVVLVEDGTFQKAIPLLEQVVAKEPDIQIAQLHLGVARARQRQYARAVAPLRKAIELQPDVMLAHYELGVALYETGELKSAAGEFEIVAQRMPKWADARYSLASVYARISRVPDAVRELKAALELEPAHGRANLLLGRILTLQGDAVSGVTYLERAVTALPTLAEPQQFLADAYDKLGRAADAERARQRAAALTKRQP